MATVTRELKRQLGYSRSHGLALTHIQTIAC